MRAQLVGTRRGVYLRTITCPIDPCILMPAIPFTPIWVRLLIFKVLCLFSPFPSAEHTSPYSGTDFEEHYSSCRGIAELCYAIPPQSRETRDRTVGHRDGKSRFPLEAELTYTSIRQKQDLPMGGLVSVPIMLLGFQSHRVSKRYNGNRAKIEELFLVLV